MAETQRQPRVSLGFVIAAAVLETPGRRSCPQLHVQTSFLSTAGEVRFCARGHSAGWCGRREAPHAYARPVY
jgi:hypothetical protein